MKSRNNITVEVSIHVTHNRSVCDTIPLASVSKSAGGEMTTRDIMTVVKSLIIDTRASALETLESIATKDEEEELAAEKK